MPAKKSKTKKAAASWRTLTRKAAALEKANRGKPTPASKRLRTQASNLRKAERAGKKPDPRAEAINAMAQIMSHTPSGGWKADDTTSHPKGDSDQPPRTYTQHEIDAAVAKAAHQATVNMEVRIVTGAMAAYEIEDARAPSNNPWVFTRAETAALMNVLRRAGYTSHGPYPMGSIDTEKVA